VSALLLGIDLGTTTAKSVIYDAEGNLIASSTVEYPIYYPQPGWAEQNAEEWWDAVVKTIRDVIKKVNPTDISGICVSGQREGVAPLTKDGEVLDRVIIWMDRRSVPEAEMLKKQFSESEIFKITGLRIDSTFTATKLLWLKKHKPKIYERTYCFLQPKDFIVYKLTGEFVTDYSIASRTLLFDVVNRSWSEKLFEMFNLDIEKFPKAIPAHKIAGEIPSEVARTTGLKKGTPVLAGGGDRPIESLGAGVILSKMMSESTGTGLSATVPLEEPFFDKNMNFIVGVHVIPNMWALETGIGVIGAILRWYRDNFGLCEKRLGEFMNIRGYELLDLAADLVPPGSNKLFVVPMFMGARVPRWNPYVRGVIFGLTLAHNRIHIARAIMEGAAYEFRYCFETLERTGIKIEEIRSIGGGGKTPLWAQIKADILNRPVVLPKERDAGPLGDAILAGFGVGVFSNLKNAVDTMVKVEKIIHPNKENVQIYEKYYRVYLKLVDALTNVYNELASLPEAKPKEVRWTKDKLIHLLYLLE